MDLSLDELLSKAGLNFEKIKCSSKRADVLESLSRRIGLEADVVQVAMWETQWEAKVKESSQEEQPPSLSYNTLKEETVCSPDAEVNENSGTHAHLQGGAVRLTVEFVDPLKGTVLSFHRNTEGRGMFYKVNDVPRCPFTRVTVQTRGKTRGPRIVFPELQTAATIPWESSQTVLLGLRALAETCSVEHNFPIDGLIGLPDPSTAPRMPSTGVPKLPPAPPSANNHLPWYSSGSIENTQQDDKGSTSPKRAGGTDGAVELTEPPSENSEGSRSWRYDPYSTVNNPCSLPPGERPASDRRDRQRLIISEGDTLTVPPGCIARVVNAKFGCGERWFSASEPVRKRLSNGGILPFAITLAALDLSRDPAPGEKKQLVIVYKPDKPQEERAEPIPQGSGHVDKGTLPPSPQVTAAAVRTGSPPWRAGNREVAPKAFEVPAQASSSVPSGPQGGEYLMESQSDGPPPLEDTSGDGRNAYLLLVRFKYGRSGEFQYGQSLPHGTHAIVEAKHGEDLGLVSDSRPAGIADLGQVRLRVVRRATDREIEWWRVKLAAMEREARTRCQEVLVKEGITFMKIAHAELQYDMSALTFHYAWREKRPDIQEVYSKVVPQLAALWTCKIHFVPLSSKD